MVKRQRAKKQGVHHAENSGTCADAESDDEDREGGESSIARKRAEGVANVLEEHAGGWTTGAKKRLAESKNTLLTLIADCNIVITDCNMRLGEKLRYLREVEGTLRGLDREILSK